MESTVNPLASARCRYFSGAIFNDGVVSAVCGCARDKAPGGMPNTAMVKTARTNNRDSNVILLLPPVVCFIGSYRVVESLAPLFARFQQCRDFVESVAIRSEEHTSELQSPCNLV